MAQRSRLSTGLSGVAGEYLVAAELSRRGYIASITLRNTRGIDILASNADATRSVGIQVKTNQRSSRSWVLNEKVERPVRGELAENLFHLFLLFGGVPAGSIGNMQDQRSALHFLQGCAKGRYQCVRQASDEADSVGE